MTNEIPPEVQEKIKNWYGKTKTLVLWKILHVWEQDGTHFFVIYSIRSRSLDMVRVFPIGDKYHLSVDSRFPIQEMDKGMM